MITETQKEAVFRYLMSQELQVDIAVEIFDHFISQINDLLIQGKDFESAFEDVEASWQKDLAVNSNLIFAYNQSRLKKRVWWARHAPLIKKALLYAIAPALGILAIVPLVKFKYLTIGLVIIFLIYLIIFFSSNYKFYKKSSRLKKKYDYYTLSSFDDMSSMIGLIVNLPNLFNLTYQAIVKDTIEITQYGILFFMLYAFCFAIFYAHFSLDKFKNSIEEIQPFLKYLRANPFYS